MHRSWRTIPLLVSVMILASARPLRAGDDIYALQTALDQARAARDDAIAELDRTTQTIREHEQWLADAPGKVERASAALVRFGAELPDRRAARDDAQQRLRERADVTKQLHDEAWSRFSSRTEYVDVEDRLAATKVRLDAHIASATKRLETDRRHQQLLADARQAEQLVAALRSDPRVHPDELAAASQAWLDAKSAVQRDRDETIESDRYVREARAMLDDATRRHRELLDEFDRSLEEDPQMRDAKQQLALAESELSRAEYEFRDLTAARDAAERDVRALQDGQAGREKQLADARSRADQLRSSIDTAEQDVRRLEDELSYAIAAYEAAPAEYYEPAYVYPEVIVGFDYFYNDQHHDHGHYDDRHHKYGHGRYDNRHHDHDRDHDGRGKRYDRREGRDSGEGREGRDSRDGRDGRGAGDARDRERSDRGPVAQSPDQQPRGPRLIDESQRQRQREEETRRQDEDRRAKRGAREAELQKQREQNQRRQADNEARRREPPQVVERKPAEAKPAPKPPRKIVVDAPPAAKVGPQPAAPREPKKTEAKREEPRRSEKKSGSTNDRGDRSRKGK